MCFSVMCQMALDSVIHSLYCILHIFDILFKIDILQRVMELNKKKERHILINILNLV